MNIAIFTDSFFPGIGGTEKAVYGLAKELSKTNNVAVIAPKYHNCNDKYSFTVIRVPSIQISKNDYMAMPKLSCNLRKFLKEFKPDIIHSQSASGVSGYGIRYAKKHKIPSVITIHTKFKMAFEKSIKSKTIVNILINSLLKIMNQATCVCTVSTDMIAELQSYGFKDNITVIRNGAMFDKIQDFSQNKVLAQNYFNINKSIPFLLFVGRIVTYKNIQVIIDSLYNLKQNNIKFQMFFVGTGSDDDYFKKQIKDLNITDNVTFTGEIKDKSLLSSLYSNADLFLFPSKFDNDPLVVVESAVHRVPALTIANTGSSERITNNKNGFITDSELTFANSLQTLIQNKELIKTCGLNAELTIPKSWLTTSNEYLEIYKKIKE
ncbi:MAG: glycosyltransferase [Clostridia bacterium]